MIDLDGRKNKNKSKIHMIKSIHIIKFYFFHCKHKCTTNLQLITTK
jgi:hypothetical protein